MSKQRRVEMSAGAARRVGPAKHTQVGAPKSGVMRGPAALGGVVLRKVGGSTVMAIPPAFLTQLGLSAASKVRVELKDGKIVVSPAEPAPAPVARRSKYRLQDLLAQCDPNSPLTNEDEEWLANGPAGKELL